MSQTPRQAIRSYRDLEVWQRSYQVALYVYRHTAVFPAHERFGLVSQLRRAAVSIPANVAEGHARQHRQEYVQFLYIAQGSVAEVETLLRLSRDPGYLDESVLVSLCEELQVVGKMLARLVSALARTAGKGPGTARASGRERS